MRKSTRVLAPTLVLGMVLGAGSVSANGTTVTIDSGDTLSEIAEEHEGVTLEDIYELNPNIEPFDLEIGSEVKISSKIDNSNDDNSEEFFHTVEPGETLQSIANLHADLTLEGLYELNPDIEEGQLTAGSEVRVKATNDEGNTNENEESEKFYHTIKSGDTLASIAQTYEGVTLEDIYDLNHGIDPFELTVGNNILIRPMQQGEDQDDKSTKKVYHTIKAGNTLQGIADQYEGVRLKDLFDLNPKIEPRSLTIGAEVRVK